MPAAIANGETGVSARTKINQGFVDITHGGVDNALLRANGVDATLQSSGIIVNDTNDLTGLRTFESSRTDDGTHWTLDRNGTDIVTIGATATQLHIDIITGGKIIINNNSLDVDFDVNWDSGVAIAVVGSTGVVTIGTNLIVSGTFVQGASTAQYKHRGSLGFIQSTAGLISNLTDEGLTLGNTNNQAPAINFVADNATAGDLVRHALIQATMTVRTDNAEAGNLKFFTANGVGVALAMTIDPDRGVILGSPTGGSQGVGTLNATGVFDDGVLLTDHVFEHEFLGHSIDEKSQEFKRKTIKEEFEFVKESLHLSSIIGRAGFKKKRPSTGQLLSQIWETIEVQFLYINELREKIEILESR